jgi:HK97 family phage portal protein
MLDAGDLNYDLEHMQPWPGWETSWATPWLEPAGWDEWTGYGYGRKVGLDAYMGSLSTVMTCIHLTSSQLASMPPYVQRGPDPVKAPEWCRPGGSPQPEHYATWAEFVKLLVNSMMLRGFGALHVTSRYEATGMPRSFVLLNPDWVRFEPNDLGSANLFLGETPLDDADTLIVPFQRLPGRLRPVGPVEWAGASIIQADLLERYAGEIARHGVSAVLKFPQAMNRTQANDAKGAWMESRRATGGAVAVLSGGAEYQPLSMSPKDMAMVDLMHMDENRVAAAMGVPGQLLGLPVQSGLTYSSTVHLTDFWWRTSLRTLAEQVAQSLSRFLVHGQQIRFNRDEFTRPDPLTHAQAIETLHRVTDAAGNPALTVNEARIDLGLKPYHDAETPGANLDDPDRFLDAEGLSGVRR